MNFGYIHNEKYAKFSIDSLGKKIASGMNFKPQFVGIAFLWLFIEQKCSSTIAITFLCSNSHFHSLSLLFFSEKNSSQLQKLFYEFVFSRIKKLYDIELRH